MANTQAKGYQQITNLAAAVGLTVPTGTSYAIIKVSGQAVRCRDDGTDPTAAVGYPLAVGAELLYDAQLARIKFIEQVAGATLDILYYGVQE